MDWRLEMPRDHRRSEGCPHHCPPQPQPPLGSRRPDRPRALPHPLNPPRIPGIARLYRDLGLICGLAPLGHLPPMNFSLPRRPLNGSSTSHVAVTSMAIGTCLLVHPWLALVKMA